MSTSDKKFYDKLLFIDYMSVFNTMIWPEVMVIGWTFSCDKPMQRICLTCEVVLSSLIHY